MAALWQPISMALQPLCAITSQSIIFPHAAIRQYYGTQCKKTLAITSWGGFIGVDQSQRDGSSLK